MANFSLSPAVTVREINLSQNVPNIPSARTGLVLRADYGQCLTPIGVTNENELVGTFGRPSSNNYQDWFQAWNFLQYASSLFITRPVPSQVVNNTTVNYKNAGIAIQGNVADSDNNQEMYNANKAETTLQNITVPEKLNFYNKYVVPKQTIALSICSSEKYWDSPIATPYAATVDSSAITSGQTVTVTNNSLVKGNKILSNATSRILNVISSNATSIKLDYSFASVEEAKKELSLGYITPTITTGTPSAGTFTLTSSSHNAKEGQVYDFGSNKYAYVESIANSGGVSTITFNFPEKANITVGGTTTVYTVGEAVWFDLADVYLTNSITGIPALTQAISVLSGHRMPVGTEISISTNDNLVIGSTALGTESGDVYTVISIDEINNIIYLDKPLQGNVTNMGGASISPTNKTYIDLDSTGSKLIGINLLEEKFDSSLVKKTRLTAEIYSDDASARIQKPYVKEELLSFSDLLEFELNWKNNEFITAILDKDSNDKYFLAEKIVASYSEKARDNSGRNMFADNIFFDNSKYVYVKTNSATYKPLVNSSKAIGVGLFEFTGDSNTDYTFDKFSKSSVQFAFEEFANPESFDVNILLAHSEDMNYASTIAETRKDCIAIVAPFNANEIITKSASEATKFLNERYGSRTKFDNKVFNTFGTYTAVYGNMKYQYDKFNDVNRWIAVLGDVAGLYAQTDTNRDPWWAPAGSERGVMKNVIKLAFNPAKQNRDDLYVNAINPILNIPGEGAGVVYGQKTATAISSAMDRVNVRRLLIFIEKAIATAARVGIFEFNDPLTRQRLFGLIDPFLRTVQARRGIYEYLVDISDETNNAEIIDQNGLIINIYIKPTKVAEFINLNIISVKTGVSFSEVAGSI